MSASQKCAVGTALASAVFPGPESLTHPTLRAVFPGNEETNDKVQKEPAGEPDGIHGKEGFALEEGCDRFSTNLLLRFIVPLQGGRTCSNCELT